MLERVAAAGVDLRETGADGCAATASAAAARTGCRSASTSTAPSGRLLGRDVQPGGPSAALNLTLEELRPERERAAGRVTFATDVRAQPVGWLIPGRVPLAAVTLFAGDPKLGKSTLSGLFAAGVSLGRFGAQPATVLIVSAEDSFARVIKPRAPAAGADLHRIGKFDVVDDEGVRFPIFRRTFPSSPRRSSSTRRAW